MVKKAEIPEAVKSDIVNLNNSGVRISEIANVLKAPKQTVFSIIARYKIRYSVKNNSRNGRPRATIARKDIRIVCRSKADLNLTVEDTLIETFESA
ncbi:hypothetical protein OESDEN_09786 [Oesophagostomum dentatum]|uniref:Paired domain-containing protein n=1 Tax=Oesophagostomum dentatum TaxID=61180 RepID=A0A0B1SYI9_OESDE|nr:hypothetical protein OESDEN_09786 [Oesophagostomum dentatum]